MSDLIRLVRPKNVIISYPEDVRLISDALMEMGYTASDDDIEWAYKEWCQDSWAASWIGVDRCNAKRGAVGILGKLIAEES